ncbi:MAG: Asp-tRNA(Asn)/Glu-tRNA(Gln) amidotransferase subunit GatC [Candidatus Marinimicrobia bacterium]|nr:Asp-tRNA(Asn)/Glu-tRNA(Gln) amidotransferase subunit GatC [Candidatus Neomarinimicrobiota bacterium]
MGSKTKITKKEVLKIASLAKLSLSEGEIEMYTNQMNDILAYMDQLNELDTDDIEPLSHVLDLTNVTRADKEKPSLDREDVLKNAPETDGEYFIVPKVINK